MATLQTKSHIHACVYIHLKFTSRGATRRLAMPRHFSRCSGGPSYSTSTCRSSFRCSKPGSDALASSWLISDDLSLGWEPFVSIRIKGQLEFICVISTSTTRRQQHARPMVVTLHHRKKAPEGSTASNEETALAADLEMLQGCAARPQQASNEVVSRVLFDRNPNLKLSLVAIEGASLLRSSDSFLR